jgi:hypothetical protein
MFMKRVLSTKTHSFIDYLMGAAMILSPWMLGIHQQTPAYILIIAGIVGILRNLATDYEGGIVCQISMQQHLRTDIISGMLLAACPFIFTTHAVWPIIVFGALQVIIALITHTVPSYKGYHGFTYKKFEKFPSMKY